MMGSECGFDETEDVSDNIFISQLQLKQFIAGVAEYVTKKNFKAHHKMRENFPTKIIVQT